MSRRLTQEEHKVRDVVHRWMDNNAYVVFEDAESAAEEIKEMVTEWCEEWLEDYRDSQRKNAKYG